MDDIGITQDIDFAIIEVTGNENEPLLKIDPDGKVWVEGSHVATSTTLVEILNQYKLEFTKCI
jgi:hypothetical protein